MTLTHGSVSELSLSDVRANAADAAAAAARLGLVNGGGILLERAVVARVVRQGRVPTHSSSEVSLRALLGRGAHLPDAELDVSEDASSEYRRRGLRRCAFRFGFRAGGESSCCHSPSSDSERSESSNPLSERVRTSCRRGRSLVRRATPTWDRVVRIGGERCRDRER